MEPRVQRCAETKGTRDAFIEALPKVDLHTHIADSVATDLLFAIADRNGVALPYGPDEIYQSTGLDDYLQRLAAVCSVLQEPRDFHEVLLAALKAMASTNTRYCEVFFNPDDHELAYPAMLEAYCQAIADAESVGIEARLLPSINRTLGASRGMDLVETVLAHPCEAVIGIGLDNDEMGARPALFSEAFARAKASGLKLSAHAGERRDVSDLQEAVDCLSLDRVDHGYAVVRDAHLTARLKAADIPFTACWTACALVNGSADPVADMLRANLNVTLNTDAIAAFSTDLNREYRLVANALDLDTDQIAGLAAAGVRASYMTADAKTGLLKEIECVQRKYGSPTPGGRGPDEATA